jgi:thiamine monophosphate synthase
MSDEIMVVNRYVEVKAKIEAYGWHLAACDGEWHVVDKDEDSTVFSCTDLHQVRSWMLGYDHGLEGSGPFMETIEKLKEAGATLIRAINGPSPRPNIDDSIDKLEELLESKR